MGVALKIQHVLYPNSQMMRDWIVSDDGTGEKIVFWNDAIGPQPSQATLDAITDQQVEAARSTRFAQAAKTAAASSIDNGATIAADQRERIERCIVSIICAEFNRHTDVEAAMFAAVAAATSLDNLKTRFAAISQVPQRSLADLVAAIKTALAATPE